MVTKFLFLTLMKIYFMSVQELLVSLEKTLMNDWNNCLDHCVSSI